LSHSPQASAWGPLLDEFVQNRFNGFQFVVISLINKTVETVSASTTPPDPKLKLGENEK